MTKNRVQTIPRRPGERGFSFVELIVVFAIFAAMAAVSIPMLGNAINEMRLNNSLEAVTMELRRARQAAVDYRRFHRITVEADGRIVLERQEMPSRDWTLIKTEFLPNGVQFAAPSGSPSGDASPDGMGTDAIDLGGGNSVIFRPDGSGRDVSGDIVNGVIYVSSVKHPDRGKAVTLLGATGRIKAWELGEGEQGSMEWK